MRGRIQIVDRATFLRVSRARDLIHHAYAEPLTLADLGQAAGLSRHHFLRSFERVFGVSPHRYLVELRLEHAKRLLAAQALSVTETCVAVGFSSVGSFSTLFRREVGCAPSVYRKGKARWVSVPADVGRLCIPFCFAVLFGAA